LGRQGFTCGKKRKSGISSVRHQRGHTYRGESYGTQRWGGDSGESVVSFSNYLEEYHTREKSYENWVGGELGMKIQKGLFKGEEKG